MDNRFQVEDGSDDAKAQGDPDTILAQSPLRQQNLTGLAGELSEFQDVKEPSNFNRILITLATLLALLGSAYFSAERIAEFVKRKPTPLPVPTKPEPPQSPTFPKAERDGIEVAIGVDSTKSSISKKLGTVKAAIKSFVETAGNGSLKKGDTVTVCEIGKGAACDSFDFPAQTDALIARIERIRAVGMETKLTTALEDILRFIRGRAKNALIAVWTDAENGEKKPLNPECSDQANCPKVEIIVPDEKFLKNAEALVADIKRDYNGETGFEVAKTGEEFNALLSKYTKKLEQFAQMASDAKVQGDYDKMKETYEKELVEHQKELERLEKEYQAALEKHAKEAEGLKETIAEAKKTIREIVLMLAALIASIGAALLWNEKRPKLSGYITDENDPNRTRRIPLPGKKKPIIGRKPAAELNIGGQSFQFNPAKRGGPIFGGRQLEHGEELKPGSKFFYHAKGRSRDNIVAANPSKNPVTFRMPNSAARTTNPSSGKKGNRRG